MLQGRGCTTEEAETSKINTCQSPNAGKKLGFIVIKELQSNTLFETN